MGIFERMMGHARQFERESGISKDDVENAGCISPCESELISKLAELDGAVRLSLLFSGSVQGVGFRWTNQELARERNLTGWVRNLPDGTVRMEIQGTARALAAHLERIHAYYRRFGNRVWLESARSLPRVDSEGDFEVRF